MRVICPASREASLNKAVKAWRVALGECACAGYCVWASFCQSVTSSLLTFWLRTPKCARRDDMDGCHGMWGTEREDEWECVYVLLSSSNQVSWIMCRKNGLRGVDHVNLSELSIRWCNCYTTRQCKRTDKRQWCTFCGTVKGIKHSMGLYLQSFN